jgi:peptidoglycan/LPS O-acetylase OafA/YrhL/vacuolar-type H+-ATPase subunit F/Vma7
MAFSWMVPTDMIDYSQSLITTPLFVSNFLFFLESGYFDATIEIKPLFHTWSLSVEEQFYIIFPIIIMALWRFGLKIIIISVAILFIASLILSESMLSIDKMVSFYMLPTRIWQLLLGVGISILNYKNINLFNNCIIKNLFGVIGLILIIFAVSIFSKDSPMPGYYSLVPTIGAGLIIMFDDHKTIVGKLLGNNAFVSIGLISYSAYLWHQPLFAYIRIYRFGDVKPGMYISAILITLILAYLTWKFIENPFRNKKIISLKKLVISLTFAGLLLIGIGIAGIVTNGFEHIYKSKLTKTELSFFKNSQEMMKLRNEKNKTFNYPECFIEYSNTDNFQNNFNKCTKKNGSAIILMGDSHMNNLRRSLTHINDNVYNFIVSIGTYHCHAYHYYESNSKSKCDLKQAINFIKTESSNIDYLIYNQLGSYLITDKNKNTLNNINVKDVKDTKLFVAKNRITKTLNYFSNITDNIKVIWLSSWAEPLYPMHNPRKVARITNGNISYISNALAMFGSVESLIEKTIEKQKSKVIFIPLYDKKNKTSFIPIIKEDCIMFNDTNHLSSCGERMASLIFKERIDTSLTKAN